MTIPSNATVTSNTTLPLQSFQDPTQPVNIFRNISEKVDLSLFADADLGQCQIAESEEHFSNATLLNIMPPNAALTSPPNATAAAPTTPWQLSSVFTEQPTSPLEQTPPQTGNIANRPSESAKAPTTPWQLSSVFNSKQTSALEQLTDHIEKLYCETAQNWQWAYSDESFPN